MPRRLLCALTFLLCALRASPDIVILKNGGKIEGKAVEKWDRYEITVGDGKMTVPKSEVVRIDRGSVPSDEFRKRKEALPPDDVEGLFRLGLWCRDAGMAEEAGAAFQDVIRRSPDHAGAREALGFSRVNGKWIQGSWQNLATAHFRIETDCPDWLIRGLDDALEKYFEALSGEFRAHLAWEDPPQVIPIQFFRRKNDYVAFMKQQYGPRHPEFREAATMPRGWADLARMRVYTHYETDPRLSEDANREIARCVLFHEANHLLWWLGVVRAAGGDPEAYAEARYSWFEEGLAEYFALTRYEQGRYQIHTPGGDMLRLARLQNLAVGLKDGKYAPLRDYLGKRHFDFMGADIGVLYAQAWSFVEFFFRADQGKYRDVFWKYLGEVRAGRGGMEVLEKLTGMGIDRIEASWLAHVKEEIATELK